ncbi:MAG: STAS/SEC14 domain-containing protein [candidate division KSB1 bacterium]|nr:STAS/SEC14 domain-containing protein [candidate division KSB1 bacterium]
MYQVVHETDGHIELSLWSTVTEEEFKQVIHQLESLCTSHQKIHVLLDAARMEKYDFNIYIEEFDFYKKYKEHLGRVALVSDKAFEKFMTGVFSKFSQIEFKSFGDAEIEKAREFIFPSRLP